MHTNPLLQALASVGEKHPSIQKMVLFGSRARGDASERSDYDIAVFTEAGFPERDAFYEAIDSIHTLYKIDIVEVKADTDPFLRKEIAKDGVIIMTKETKLTNYLRAEERLREALEEYADHPSTLSRDGVIQRFEFTTELAWKACREFLMDQGFADMNSPKETMRQAFQYGMLDNGDAWVAILNDRNRTSHIYDDATAEDVFVRIRDAHIHHFRSLAAFFRK